MSLLFLLMATGFVLNETTQVPEFCRQGRFCESGCYKTTEIGKPIRFAGSGNLLHTESQHAINHGKHTKVQRR